MATVTLDITELEEWLSVARTDLQERNTKLTLENRALRAALSCVSTHLLPDTQAEEIRLALGQYDQVATCATGTPAEITANHQNVARAIEAQGFKDVVIQDYGMALSWDGCGKDDTLVAHALATNAFGARVKLIACSGLVFKGVTIRTE